MYMSSGPLLPAPYCLPCRLEIVEESRKIAEPSQKLLDEADRWVLQWQSFSEWHDKLCQKPSLLFPLAPAPCSAGQSCI